MSWHSCDNIEDTQRHRMIDDFTGYGNCKMPCSLLLVGRLIVLSVQMPQAAHSPEGRKCVKIICMHKKHPCNISHT